MLYNEKHALLRAFVVQLIPDIDEATWNGFAEKLVVRNIKKGEHVLRPGMYSNHVSYVNYGLLRTYYLIDGKEMITAFFNENCYFSDYESFLSRKPCVMYSEALEDTEIVDIAYDELQGLYDKYPQCERVGRLIAEDLFVHLSNKVSSFLLDTPEQRYYRFLEELGDVAQRVPQYMIASYLGITPEALSRIRSRSRKKGKTARFIDSDQ